MATFEVEPEWREATAEAALTPYLLTRYFGLRSFSTLYGFTWTAYAIAGAIGPLLMGMAFDVTGSYTLLSRVGGRYVRVRPAISLSAALSRRLGPVCWRTGRVSTALRAGCMKTVVARRPDTLPPP